jgi:hypothetical protein
MSARLMTPPGTTAGERSSFSGPQGKQVEAPHHTEILLPGIRDLVKEVAVTLPVTSREGTQPTQGGSDVAIEKGNASEEEAARVPDSEQQQQPEQQGGGLVAAATERPKTTACEGLLPPLVAVSGCSTAAEPTYTWLPWLSVKRRLSWYSLLETSCVYVASMWCDGGACLWFVRLCRSPWPRPPSWLGRCRSS